MNGRTCESHHITQQLHVTNSPCMEQYKKLTVSATSHRHCCTQHSRENSMQYTKEHKTKVVHLYSYIRTGGISPALSQSSAINQINK